MEDEDYHIDVHLQAAPEPIDAERLRHALRATLEQHHQQACRISLAIVDDARIGDLNQRYLNHPGPTDCLSFDLRDSEDTDPVEGEIVVSWETARREAARRGISVEAELTLYAIHGLLHLLGYDDQEPQDATRMHRTEDQILNSLGLGPVYGVRPK